MNAEKVGAPLLLPDAVCSRRCPIRVCIVAATSGGLHCAPGSHNAGDKVSKGLSSDMHANCTARTAAIVASFAITP